MRVDKRAVEAQITGPVPSFTEELGTHPLSAVIGAIAGGLAGLLVGMAAGPLGSLLGIVGGAVIGGSLLGGAHSEPTRGEADVPSPPGP